MVRIMVLRLLLAVIVGALMAGSASAQRYDSAYSRIGDCEPRDPPEPYGFLSVFMACRGYGGWTVYVGATDSTARVAFGARNLDRQFSQAPLEAIGALASTGETIEWRLSGRQAFATILRWRVVRRGEDGAETLGEHLVVSALEGSDSACHAAYVDVRTVPNANTVARRAADTIARGFQCGAREPVRIGPAEARRLMAGG
jgi:hypothetical protein